MKGRQEADDKVERDFSVSLCCPSVKGDMSVEHCQNCMVGRRRAALFDYQDSGENYHSRAALCLASVHLCQPASSTVQVVRPS